MTRWVGTGADDAEIEKYQTPGDCRRVYRRHHYATPPVTTQLTQLNTPSFRVEDAGTYFASDEMVSHNFSPEWHLTVLIQSPASVFLTLILGLYLILFLISQYQMDQLEHRLIFCDRRAKHAEK